jgi:hypothetical protein
VGRFLCLILLLLFAAGCAAKVGRSVPAEPDPIAAERKAVAYLIREVPAWHRENQCFSCHNNGDAARALYIASRKGHRVPASTLADTTAWLSRPEQWKNNKGDPGFSDPRLANLQFASALLTATKTGHIKDTSALATAAALVAADQAHDGSWPVEPANPIGSPATYGTALATYTGWQLVRTSPDQAKAWLSALKAQNTPASAVLLHLNDSEPALAFLLRAQTADGGWGPYVATPPEPFDTALALLALNKHRKEPGVTVAIRAGRNYLAAQQQPDGSWPATTRPPRGESYAQTVSTTAWATLALLETRR